MNHRQEKEQVVVNRRMNFLFFLVFVALAILIWRLSFVQITQGADYAQIAQGNQFVTQDISAPRGNIYDRDKTLLVGNKPSYTITFQALNSNNQNPMELVAKLYPALGMDPVKLFDAMDPYGDKYSLGIARNVITNATPKQVAYIKEHQSELPGFNVEIKPVRDYFNTDGLPRASHILGYLNSIPQDYWKQHQNEYQQTDLMGTAGVEKQYESLLKGKDGQLKEEVNKNYQPMNQSIAAPPVKGHDLVLTLDAHLQFATEQALKTTVTNLHKTVSTITTAAAVAVNPKTGEILALVSYPDFDPNQWINGMSDTEYQQDFEPGEMNRALTMNYFPGSTVKMATSLIALRTGAITKDYTYYDPGYIQVGYDALGHPNLIHSWQPLGNLNVVSALAQSSNVFMMNAFLKMAGYDNNMSNSQVNYFVSNTLPKYMKLIHQYHNDLGLGTTITGVDLPYEAQGTFEGEGYPSDLAFSAIGQSEKYSMMQLAQYVSTIANSGVRNTPHILKQVIDPNGTTEPPVAPKVEADVSHVFTPDEWQTVQEGMYAVTHGDGTFASVFGHYPIPVSGKTGTAETGINGTENSLFVGYAPSNNPQIAIALILPENMHNSHSYNSVGPIAKAMMDAYFHLDQPQK